MTQHERARRIAIIPGSARRASLNRRLARVLAAELAARGHAPEIIELGDHVLPLYDGDAEEEHGVPEAARALHDRLAAVDAVVLVTPEHNGGPSALLKNTIDWITRVDRAVFTPLLWGIAAASPGGRGAVGALAVVRRLLDHMRLDVLPLDLSVPHADDALVDDGNDVVVASPDAAAAIEQFVIAFDSALAERP